MDEESLRWLVSVTLTLCELNDLIDIISHFESIKMFYWPQIIYFTSRDENSQNRRQKAGFSPIRYF